MATALHTTASPDSATRARRIDAAIITMFARPTPKRPPWDRGDGFDANDPAAPSVHRCESCDLAQVERDAGYHYWPDCNDLTASWFDDCEVEG